MAEKMIFSLAVHICLILFFSSSKKRFLVIRDEGNLCQVSRGKTDKLLPEKIEDKISYGKHKDLIRVVIIANSVEKKCFKLERRY